MPKYPVAMFDQYPFTIGEKITIRSGKRAGDWEVVGLTDRKVTLRCPVSGREFEWDRFCYLVGKKTAEEWPHQDGAEQK